MNFNKRPTNTNWKIICNISLWRRRRRTKGWRSSSYLGTMWNTKRKNIFLSPKEDTLVDSRRKKDHVTRHRNIFMIQEKEKCSWKNCNPSCGCGKWSVEIWNVTYLCNIIKTKFGYTTLKTAKCWYRIRGFERV